MAARLDVTGVFGYSDEDGTEAASYDGKLDDDEIRARVEHVTALVEELTAQRAEERIGERGRGARRVASTTATSRAAPPTRAPRSTAPRTSMPAGGRAVGDLVRAVVVDTEGVDLRRRRELSMTAGRAREAQQLEPARTR